MSTQSGIRCQWADVWYETWLYHKSPVVPVICTMETVATMYWKRLPDREDRLCPKHAGEVTVLIDQHEVEYIIVTDGADWRGREALGWKPAVPKEPEPAGGPPPREFDADLSFAQVLTFYITRSRFWWVSILLGITAVMMMMATLLRFAAGV